MASNVYEGMFIFDSGKYGRDPDGVSGAISRMIEEAGGEMLVSRLWEERRLAYPINGQKKGTYWLTYFRLDGPKLPKVTRQSELDDNILRSLVLKVDPRIVDALVEHAKGATVRPSEPVAETTEGNDVEVDTHDLVAAGADADEDED